MAPTNAELVQRNKKYSATHQPMPLIDEAAGAGMSAPKTAIITCVDPRVQPEQLLGLNVGECFIFRTVAGHPQPALEGLAALDIEAGEVQDVMIIYHTDCGSLRFDVPAIRSTWVERDPTYEKQIKHMTFGAVDKNTVDQAIRDDVQWLQEQPLLRSGKGITINGYLYDLKTGSLRIVV